MRIIGLMSGTSADGIGACLAQIEERDGRLAARTEHFLTIPYPDDVRHRVLGCETAADVCRLNFELGERFAVAAIRLCESAGVPLDEVAAVGSHGQTICHLPAERAGKNACPTGDRRGSSRRQASLSAEAGGFAGSSMLQIGEPCVIAARTGITTVADFRPRDIAAGGCGAPLVPLVDYLLLADRAADRVALNIGGIANVTILPAGCTPEQVVAFDTGPGNVVIDGVMELMTQGHKRLDRDGALAARGTVHEGALNLLLENPYFRTAPPKSTGREKFGYRYAEGLVTMVKAGDRPRADVAATATALTARTVADAVRRWGFAGECEVIASGGGVHNRTLMAMLAAALAPARLVTSDAFGIDPDAKEALAFAVLAWLTLNGRPGNLPGATGAAEPVVLGKIAPGKHFTSKVALRQGRSQMTNGE